LVQGGDYHLGRARHPGAFGLRVSQGIGSILGDKGDLLQPVDLPKFVKFSRSDGAKLAKKNVRIPN
jgi:hypothetical protein